MLAFTVVYYHMIMMMMMMMVVMMSISRLIIDSVVSCRSMMLSCMIVEEYGNVEMEGVVP